MISNKRIFSTGFTSRLNKKELAPDKKSKTTVDGFGAGGHNGSVSSNDSQLEGDEPLSAPLQVRNRYDKNKILGYNAVAGLKHNKVKGADKADLQPELSSKKVRGDCSINSNSVYLKKVFGRRSAEWWEDFFMFVSCNMLERMNHDEDHNLAYKANDRRLVFHYRDGYRPIQKFFGYKKNPFLRSIGKNAAEKTAYIAELLKIRVKFFVHLKIAQVRGEAPLSAANFVKKNPYPAENDSQFKSDLVELILALKDYGPDENGKPNGLQDFACVNFYKMDFSGQTFSNCNFFMTDFTYAILSGAEFKHCYFWGTTFYSANLEGCKLTDCDFKDGKFDSRYQTANLIIPSSPSSEIFNARCRFKNDCAESFIEYSVVSDLAQGLSAIVDEAERQQAAVNIVALVTEGDPDRGLDCPISADETPLNQICLVREKDSQGKDLLHLFNKDNLWHYFMGYGEKSPLTKRKIKAEDFVTFKQFQGLVNKIHNTNKLINIGS